MHIPVLKKEVVGQFAYLRNKKGGIFVDGTIGLAGHGIALANEYPDIRIIGIDQDASALEIAKRNITAAGLENNFILIHNNFSEITDILSEKGIKHIDGVLLDLGISSMQIDTPSRGFSFRTPKEPLDMRMDQSTSITAGYIVNKYPGKELENIIRQYGEERYASVIAQNIVFARKTRPIKTIGDLIDVIAQSIPLKIQKTSGIHFATRTFQALRIEVNDELSILRKSIIKIVSILKPKSRIAVISFHSLEDRIVKQTFNRLADPCECPREMPCGCSKKPVIQIITKKPVEPSEEEIATNPRSRSSKLRVAEKI